MKLSLKTTTVMSLISNVPIFIILIFSSYFLYISYNQFLHSNELSLELEKTQILGNLSESLAKERGLSGVYIGSEGALAKELVNAQYEQTDVHVKALNSFVRQLQNENTSTELSKVVQTLDALPRIRESVMNLETDFNTIFFDFYSEVNKLISKEIFKITKISNDFETNSLALSLANVYSDIEYIGQERGFISHILTLRAPMKDAQMEIWLNIINSNSSFNIDSLVDGYVKKEIENSLKLPQNRAILEEINEVRVSIAQLAQSGEFLIEPTTWFVMLTSQIDITKEIALLLKFALNKNVEMTAKDSFWQLGISSAIWISSFIFLVMGVLLRRELKRNILGLESVFVKIKGLVDSDSTIDFGTSKGTSEAYKAIDLVIQKIADEKKIAEEASAAKSIFLANMSHEIRTPLNGIIGFTELLKNSDLDEEKREFVDVIEKSSENLLSLINNILDLSKIESNKTEIDEVIFLPIDEFESAVNVYGAKAAEKNIDLQCFIDPSLISPLKGDVSKIKETLINLLSNAVKFTPEHGVIDIQIKKKESSAQGEETIYFCVKDNGIGIDAAQQAKIFDAFSQADSTITRKYGGTGLGLTISSRLIKALGGELSLESEPNKGSSFFFTLSFPKIPSPTIQETKDLYKGFTCAILTKENSNDSRATYIYEYMNYFGVNVKFYTNFQELKEYIYKSNVSLIAVDYNLLESKDDINEYRKIHIPILLALNPVGKQVVEALKDNYITPVFKPIGPTKIINWLSQKANISMGAKAFSKDMLSSSFNAQVLVAEDNEINQKLIKRTLEDLGLDVTIVNNGSLALKARKERDYDLIFMDIAMPVMDGVEATKKILEYESMNNLPHIPIVAITANALKGDRERFMKEGLDEYITKPVKKDSIQAILSQFIPDKIEEKVLSKPKIKEEKQEIRTPKEEVVKPKDVESKSILVFKKNPIETKIFVSVLRKAGKECVEANSLHFFKEALQKYWFNIIMIDDATPGSSAEELIQLIKTFQLKHSDKLGEVFLFQDSKSSSLDAKELGISKVIPNIISKSELEKLVENI